MLQQTSDYLGSLTKHLFQTYYEIDTIVHLESWELIKPGTYFKESKEIEKRMKIRHIQMLSYVLENPAQAGILLTCYQGAQRQEKSQHNLTLTFILFFFCVCVLLQPLAFSHILIYPQANLSGGPKQKQGLCASSIFNHHENYTLYLDWNISESGVARGVPVSGFLFLN